MLRKEILPRLRKILGYSTDGWLAAYRCNDKSLQYLYDQLYNKADEALKIAKVISRYESSKGKIPDFSSDFITDLVQRFNERGKK